MDQTPNRNSKELLKNIGASLGKIYKIDSDDTSFDDLIAKLDSVGYDRNMALDSADARLLRLLSNTANQSLQ